MLAFYSEKWGAPTAPHYMGQELFPAIEEAYKNIYKLIGATLKDSVVMTSSGAEAINQAIFSTYQNVTLNTGKNHFITSAIDEAPALLSLNRLEQFGAVASVVKANSQCQVSAQSLSEVITPRTAMVALSFANGLTGVINPISEIAVLCKLRGIILLLDMTHVLGKLFVDPKELNADFLSFNGDHIHAPKGTGGLFIKEGIKCSPFIVGGMEQAGLRAGSVNVPGLVALGVAAKECLEARDYMCMEIARLKYHFESSLKKRIPEAHILFENEERLPHITCIAFPGVTSEALLFVLNRKGVLASMGGGSQQQIGYILTACGLESLLANSALSFSLSKETTEEEIDKAVAIIDAAYHRLRRVSEQIIPRIV